MKTSDIPIAIKLLLLLVISTFIVDQLSSMFDSHWAMAELTFDDPIYLGLTFLWFAVISFVCWHIIERKKHIPSTIKIIFIIVLIFFIFGVFEADFDLSIFVSFQFLELLLWLTAYLLSNNKLTSEWFIENDETELL